MNNTNSSIPNYDPVFEVSPKNTTDALGSTAVLHCVTTTQPGILTVAWIVDGVSTADPEIVSRGITPNIGTLSTGAFEGNLSIPATENNNNTEVICRAIFTTADPVNSSPVIVNIQG